eukprot:3436510-Rhodomonas_salina.1
MECSDNLRVWRSLAACSCGQTRSLRTYHRAVTACYSQQSCSTRVLFGRYQTPQCASSAMP